MPNEPITIPATPKLVEDWHGPVLYTSAPGHPDTHRCVLLDPDDRPPERRFGPLMVMPASGDWGDASSWDYMHISAALDQVTLDLRRPEVQARVLACVAASLSGLLDSVGYTWARELKRDGGYVLGCGNVQTTIDRRHRALDDFDPEHPDADLHALRAMVLWLIGEERL